MKPVLKAAIWMTGAIASFSTMAVAGREVSFALDTFEIMLFRSVVGVIIVVFAAIAFGTLRQINRQQFSLHFARNIMHFIGQNLWFYAVTVIPLAQVFALEFTSPIWVILLSPLLLGERITLIRAAAALMGFIGILVVTRPNMAGINTGVIMAASSAIFFAFTIIFTKRLTRTQSITCILFYLTVLQLGFGLITAGHDGDIALPNTETLPWLVLIGVAGLLGHFCITKALEIAPATVVVPIDFVRLPVIAIIGMLAYGEILDLWVLLGSGIIFASNYLNILSETRGSSTLE
ncbi:MAG: DMT family transporter [Ascidiaceihabitans sp.]|jgi:drug/metabolite transporter (DMT)-like permease|tara:strand:+ start:4390 stop:5262 length:873 start_codon:yes stop_codon:yes gene_type:complete